MSGPDPPPPPPPEAGAEGEGPEEEGLETAAPLSLLRNHDFVALWFAQGFSLVVNTALQFVLLILIVEKTGSSIAGSGLIIFLAAPPVVFGPISGIVVDRIDKRRVLMVTNVVRGVATLLLLVGDVSVASIYAVAFVTATMGQFNLPAAQAAVPAFVPRAQYLSANSLFQLTTAVGQLLGMVLVAPLMLKLLGFDASYIVGGVLILVTVPVLARLPALPPTAERVGDTWRGRLRAVPRDLRDTWEVVRGDRLTQLAMLQLSVGGMLLFMFALLVPRFVVDVLQRPPDDSVFVFWPVGLGALLALRALPVLGRRYSPTGIVTVGLLGLTVSIGAFGAINFLVDALESTPVGLDNVEGDVLFIAVTLVLAFPMGITYAMVNAPAQTVLHERAPAALRGADLRLAADGDEWGVDGGAAAGGGDRRRVECRGGAVRGGGADAGHSAGERADVPFDRAGGGRGEGGGGGRGGHGAGSSGGRCGCGGGGRGGGIGAASLTAIFDRS